MKSSGRGERFEESSSESENEEELVDRRRDSTIADMPSEYWQIQKLLKNLKGGNQTASVIILCSILDFNLDQEIPQNAIRDIGGLEILINLLETGETACKIGTLKILKEISKSASIRRVIADLGGLKSMVKVLGEVNPELQYLSAETIANVAKFKRARRAVRKHGGISNLVALLDLDKSANESISKEQKERVTIAGAMALWSCSLSKRNRQAMRSVGIIPILGKLLKSKSSDLLVPVAGTLQECVSEPEYRLAMRTEGMIVDVIVNLNSDNQELLKHCATVLQKCAEDEETRDLIRMQGGLDPLIEIIKASTDNIALVAAATGAVWKCCLSAKNAERFQELKSVELFIGLLQNDYSEDVLVNAVGALAELARSPVSRQQIKKFNGIPLFVDLLTGTNQALLINVLKVIGQCAEDLDSMAIIDKLDGVRLVWSLLKNESVDVQANAAWTICPCIENTKDSGEMVRSFVGGLELVVGLLRSSDKHVLAAVCAAIASIAKDEENLAVITDHGVVPLLSGLADTEDKRLRRYLSEAIGNCCGWSNNRALFGKEGAVKPLVQYLDPTVATKHVGLQSKKKITKVQSEKELARNASAREKSTVKMQTVEVPNKNKTSKEEAEKNRLILEQQEVNRATGGALFQLSRHPENCISMHEAGVVQPLVELVGSIDQDLQEAAAGCLYNIRRLALANEMNRLKNLGQA